MYGFAAAVAIAAHGAVVALLWHTPAVPRTAPAVTVRLIEPPVPAPAAAVPPPPAEVQPQPPAVRPAPKPVATPKPGPAAAPRPRPAAPPQPAQAPIPEPQPSAPAPALVAAAVPPAVAFAPPPEPELAVQCTHRPPPVYPAAARRRGQEGVVELLVELSATGAVTRVTVARSSGANALDRAAVAAVRNWRCAPARVGGVAVPATAVQRIRFSLR
ncbi:MAG: energy transducer TonB [Pseudomonadales bacterium]|nr:energy transducer TonB [Pseudomonadales bacterium]